jgi:iron complex outermembrane receptor protein
MDTLSDQLEVSPKLGVTWELDPDVALRMSVGKGFRAPSIAERYAQIRYGPFIIIRNPNVLSERSWSTEVGGRWQSRSTPSPFELDAAVFGNELYDLIEPTFVLDDPAVPIKFQNITRARILGAEVNLRFMLASTLGLETGLTVMSPTDLTTNTQLKYRNTFLSYSRASWKALPWLEGQLEYRYQDRIGAIDDRLALFVPNADARVATHIVDARVFVTPTQHVRVGLLGRNLMNYAYTEIVGNLGPTRSFILQLEYR